MKTITIDNLSGTKIKTRFSTPLEAGYYLIGLSIKTNESKNKNSEFNKAMDELRNGELTDGETFLKNLIASK